MLITNFLGPLHLADEVSTIAMKAILEQHAVGQKALDNVWILTFALLRMMAEQLDFAFDIFDPNERTAQVSYLSIERLPC